MAHQIITAVADDVGRGEGSGNHLNPTILLCAGISTAIGTLVSLSSISLQLKNYRKPVLQRLSFLSSITLLENC